MNSKRILALVAVVLAIILVSWFFTRPKPTTQSAEGEAPVNVMHHGAKGDGQTDDTPILVELAKKHQHLYLPKPAVCYKIMDSVLLHTGSILEGEFRPASGIDGGICSYSPTASAIKAENATGSRGIVIRNLQISDRVRSSRTAGYGIELNGEGGATQFTIENVSIYGFTNQIDIAKGMNSFIYGSTTLTSAIQDAVHIHGTATTSITIGMGVYASSPGRYGYYAAICNYCGLVHTACDLSGSDCYHFETAEGGQSRGVVFDGVGSEQPHGNGMFIDATNVTIMSPQIVLVGPGKAAIALSGASGVAIFSGYLQGGDYGVQVLKDPGHGWAPTSITMIGSPYCSEQKIACVGDPNKRITRVN